MPECGCQKIFLTGAFKSKQLPPPKTKCMGAQLQPTYIGGISKKNKSRIAKYPPNHEWQGPIPISRHEWRSHEWLEIGIGPCHE